jgi:hypothetical protein
LQTCLLVWPSFQNVPKHMEFLDRFWLPNPCRKCSLFTRSTLPQNAACFPPFSRANKGVFGSQKDEFPLFLPRFDFKGGLFLL